MMHEWACYQDESPVAHSCSLLNHPNSFHGGMFKLNTKSDADSLLYSLWHFECNGHTVQMLTPQSLLPPLTGTVKLSLFTHEYSSPLSLAAKFIDAGQTILVILTIAGLFPGSHICLMISYCSFQIGIVLYPNISLKQPSIILHIYKYRFTRLLYPFHWNCFIVRALLHSDSTCSPYSSFYLTWWIPFS